MKTHQETQSPETPARPLFVHEWFNATARQRPEAVAIEAGDISLNYRALAARAAGFAAALRCAGAAPDEPIALCLESRAEAIAAAIGVLSAGAGYVYLPPEYPDSRLDDMLAAASPSLAIVDASAADRLAACAARVSVPLRPIDPAAIAPGTHEPSSIPPGAAGGRDPDSLAYIVFTSGSTGRPKGIAGRLKAIDHFIRWEIDRFALEPGVRVSQLASPAFDVFLRDVFVPLCAGGTVCVPPPRTALDGRRLADWLESQDINVVHCVPSVFRLLLEHLDSSSQFSALRQVFLAGEPLVPADVRRWTSVIGDRVELVNLYGPSETTMTKFVHVVTAADASRATIPIGTPMPGASALLLNEQGRVCAPGEIGEIYIRTPYRSLGYHRRPDLTNEVFVPDPHAAGPDDVIYRTGDLARVQDDGSFEFMGRGDRQVKIRGVRVEPAEIEGVLRECAAARDVAVVDRDDGHGSRVLAAYVVAAAPDALAEIQRHVGMRVPDYAIPSTWTLIDKIPRTPNGKLDRRALPEPAANDTSADEPVRARTPVQEIVAGVFAEVLRRPRVGLHENFFNIGGHSLLATRVVSRIRRAIGVELPLRALFRAPTVAGFTEAVEALRAESKGALPDTISRADRHAPLPLSFAQQRLWFLEQLEPGTSAHHTRFARRLHGPLEIDVLRGALAAIVRRHEVLRTAFWSMNGDPVQRIDADATVAVPLVDLSAAGRDARERAARRVAAALTAAPFDLGVAPLARAALLRLTPAEHVFVVVFHHSVSDGWSVEVLVREFSALYEAIRHGRPSLLPPLTIQYADYAAWERQWLRGPHIEQELGYWRERLRDLPVLDLPTDAVRPRVASYHAGQVSVELDATLCGELRACARREGVTVFMLLLAAFQMVLGRWARQDDVVVGTDVANRELLDVEGLIGLFVNQLVLRTDLSRNPTFRELLARVRDVTLAAYAHQRLPFERLVEALGPGRDISRHPVFQTVFALRNESGANLRLGNLGTSDFPLRVGRVDPDLTIVLGDDEDGRMTGVLLYARELFARQTASRLVEHLRTLLAAAVRNPNRPIAELPMTAPDELGHSAPLDATARAAESDWESVTEAIARRAANTPHAIAVDDGHERVSYADLDRRAAQLAQHLLSLGLAAEAVVAVRLPRGIDLVVALLATLKAGVVYLPIDPVYPAAHARRLVRQSKAAVVMTNAAARLEGDPFEDGVKVIDLGRDREIVSGRPVSASAPSVDPRMLAYLIYTSGSTGAPKGVMIEHRGLWNHLRAKVEDLPLTEADIVAQNASSSFDISIWQLLAPLVSGGTVRPIGPSVATDAAALIETVEQSGITVLETVPALIDALVDDLTRRGAESPSLRRLRLLISTGEALSAPTCRRWQALYPHVPVVNAYGPTECSDDVTHARLEGAQSTGFVPLGRPLRGTRLFVLDAAGGAVPASVTGELYVGGAGVGRGYRDAPDVTAAAFVPDPFGGHGERLFKTGDLVRWAANGQLEFLGRADDQVKIRGFRIELGDVGAAVASHPGVRQSTVCARTGPAGDQRLVAYIAPRRWSIARVDAGFQLPDGTTVAEQNRNETQYLFERIFERQVYFGHGIMLADDACVLDVGANIGMFTSRVSELAPKGRIYAFEPIAPIADHLRRNSAVCGAAVRVFDYGLAEREHEAVFTYYPGYSIMSGLAKYANAAGDFDILKQYLANQSARGVREAAEALEQADDLLTGRLHGQPHTARLRRLSDVLREEAIEWVDLLKIDVQRAGLDVLRGVDEGDWPRIDQVVMEIHDSAGAGDQTRAIEAFLTRQGFDVIVEQEPLLASTDLYNVYARRPDGRSREGARPAAQPLAPPLIVQELREALRDTLPDYMTPSAFVLLRELPLTTNGKVDRLALPEPPAAPAKTHRDPRNDVEQVLREIWQDVLQAQAIGIDDDFFELGGHSLLATRVTARVRQVLRVELPVRAIFEARTIATLAPQIVARETQPGQTLKIAEVLRRASQLSPSERQAVLARAKTPRRAQPRV